MSVIIGRVRYIALLSLAATLTRPGADRAQSRSRVFSQNGIVSTSHVLASQAGARVLARGGSAADAAIAANAVLGVVEPMMCGVGGDLFVLYWEAKTGKLYGLNASGWAPRELTPEFLAKTGVTKMPASGIHSVTVPGAVDGWSKAHARFGKLPWKDLFGEAIQFAQNGHPVHEIIRSYWSDSRLKVSAEAQRVFLPGGRAPETGEMFRNPDMAWSLRMIASEGRDSFYKGAVAQRVLAGSKKLGGTMAAADLAEFSSEWVEPISTTYKGWKVYELPPNGQGMAALIMLNLMERAGADLHTQIEAMKLSYADLLTFNADPKFASVPVGGLLSKAYGPGPGQAHRRQQGQLRGPCGPSCNGRHDLSDSGGSRGQHRLLDSERLGRLGLGRGDGRHWIRTAKSRREFRAGRRASEPAGGAQAAVPHHHPGICGEGRSARRIRHHGRAQSAAGACAVHLQSG